MEILGYLASALIGISLGLVGSGGSILTIPVLVYLFHVEPALATAYSLFIVGTAALAGGVRCAFQGLVDFPATLAFAIPSFLTVFLTRRFLMPNLPDVLVAGGAFVLTKDTGIMIFFAFLMLCASLGMIRQSKQGLVEKTDTSVPQLIIFPIGMGTGMLTGLLGAGGGFMIIPALILFAGLPMKKAVGTSLIIIASNSLFGFLGDITSGQVIDYPFIFLIAGIAVSGVFAGNYLSQLIEGQKLKRGLGWFILLMGLYIVWQEGG
jgi:uncharacterized membrane protein YfcA